MYKQYIDIAEYGPNVNGMSYPAIISLGEGQRYKIDEVLGIEFSLSNEYDGYRYKVKIGEAVKHIYNDGDQWYVLIPELKSCLPHRAERRLP